MERKTKNKKYPYSVLGTFPVTVWLPLEMMPALILPRTRAAATELAGSFRSLAGMHMFECGFVCRW